MLSFFFKFNLKNGKSLINHLNKCEECTCYNGKLNCYAFCKENAETCLSKSNKETIFEWIAPNSTECCGFCKQVLSKI